MSDDISQFFNRMDTSEEAEAAMRRLMDENTRLRASARLMVVGGTDAGDAEIVPIWQDEIEGVARCLRGALRRGVTGVTIIGHIPGQSELYVASNLESAEGIIGFIERAKAYVIRCAESADGVGNMGEGDK